MRRQFCRLRTLLIACAFWFCTAVERHRLIRRGAAHGASSSYSASLALQGRSRLNIGAQSYRVVVGSDGDLTSMRVPPLSASGFAVVPTGPPLMLAGVQAAMGVQAAGLGGAVVGEATTVAPTTGAPTTTGAATTGAPTTGAPTTGLPTTTGLATTTGAATAGGTTAAPAGSAVVPVEEGSATTASPAATTAAPTKSKGVSVGVPGGLGKIVFRIFALVLIVLLLVACGLRIRSMRNKSAAAYRPGMLSQVKSDESDAKVWQTSKARTTYRKSVLKQQQESSPSESEPAEKKQGEKTAGDADAAPDGGASGARSSVQSTGSATSKGGGYRDRRGK